MKILFVSNTPNSRTAGMARIMHHLRDEMIKQGHQVDLIFREKVPYFKSFRRLSEFLYPFFLIGAIRKVWREKGRHDVVAIHSLEGAPYVFLRRIFKKWPPCVIISYGSDEMRWEVEKEEDKLGFRKLRLFSKIFYYNIVIRQARYATRHADHVVVAAKSEINFYEKRYGKSPSEVTFIANGVAEDFLIRRNYARPAVKLLFLGGWEWRKGTRYLIESFKELAVLYSNLTLSVIGGGVGEDEIKSRFPENLRDRILVTPHVPAAELPQVYAEHDIFVFPSLFESMSLVLPEAMASGMPVVTTRTCGMQDIVTDGKNGFLAPVRDARALTHKITQLRVDAGLRQKYGTAAQETARTITWPKVALQWVDVFKKVIA